MIARICRYLSHLDGVEVAKTNQSGSHYFNAPRVKIRVSDHLSCSFNPTTTLNIMVDTKTQSFCVFYGNRIIPITSYDKLKEFLRNFVMVCDILAPLTKMPKQIKDSEKVVLTYSDQSVDIRNLTQGQVKGLNKIANQYRDFNKKGGVTAS